MTNQDFNKALYNFQQQQYKAYQEFEEELIAKYLLSNALEKGTKIVDCFGRHAVVQSAYAEINGACPVIQYRCHITSEEFVRGQCLDTISSLQIVKIHEQG